MSILHSIILGIVEGLTEFLPISSTAHMDIVRIFLGIPTSEFIKSFEIIIQLGAILAVVVLYCKRILSSRICIRNLIISFLPTAIIGFVLYKLIKSYLLGNIVIEALALLLGGIIIVLFEKYYAASQISTSEQSESVATIEKLPVRTLLILGVMQALAVIPGVSRSGAVIIGGRMLRVPKIVIVEFSFLLAIPTMLAASGYDILKSGIHFSSHEWGSILIGFVTSFIVAYVVIRWLLSYIRSHSFAVFGWYRIGLGLVLFALLFL